MSAFEQLTAVQALLNELVAEQNHEVLLTRLREGPFPEPPAGREYGANFPYEEYTLGAVITVAALAQQVYEHLRHQFPLPAGSSVATDSRISTSWRGLLRPGDAPPE